MDRVDVAIVGAGPAGSRTAWRLARGGARVALIDDSHPREKACGGGVTSRALAVVADAVPMNQISGLSVRTASFEHRGRLARLDLVRPDSAPLLVVSRREFDGRLRRAALDAGAVAVESRATDVRPDGVRWVVRTRDDAIGADWVVGADGAASLVRRRVLRPFDRADLSIATGYFVHGVSNAEIAIAFEEAPPGYLWSFPRPDHLAVGVCAQADQSSSAALLPVARRWIDANVGQAARDLERYSWPIPSLSSAALSVLQVAGRRWMLVGDAAGLVDPITREGIFFALLSADAAADALLGDASDPAREFERRIHAEITPELVRAARMKARFFAPAFVALLVSALQQRAAIRAVMADLLAGFQTYRGLRRRLLATWEFRLMLQLLAARAGR